MGGPQREDVTGRPIDLRDVDLDLFFSPRTIAVIGASDGPGRPTTTMWRKIRDWGRRTGARVIPVNPRHDTIDGVPAVASITDIVPDVDLAVILVGSAVEMFEAVLEKKPAFAMIFSAGFAETGAEGERLQQRLEDLVASSDTRLLGPNTNLNAFEDFRELPGPAIALITQSGHQGRPVFQAQELGVAVSHWAPTGNEVDLEFADFAAYFAGCEGVGAIAAYIEGFKDGRTLMLAADQAAQRRVPLVVVKVGRTAEGASMARSHTGHLAGNDRVTDGVFRQFGITRVDGLDELTDTAAMLARAAPPATEGICIYGISGGTGAHMADLCASAGLSIPSLAEDTVDALAQWIPDYLHISNPVDCGGPPVVDERGRMILDALIADPRVGVIICPITGALPALSGPLARDLAAAAETTEKPICVVWGSPLLDDLAYTNVLLGSKAHVFRTFGNCVGAVKAYVDYHAFLAEYRSPFGRPVMQKVGPARAVEPMLAGSGPLSEYESKQVLAAYGIDLPRERVCASATEAANDAADIGFPVVMKVASADLTHKSDHGLVQLGVRNATDAKRAYNRLMKRAQAVAPDARIDGVLVAETVTGGVETVIGVSVDELFGPVVMFGLGGVLVEVFDDVSFRVPPFDLAEGRRMIDETTGSLLLQGVRGQPKIGTARLVDVLMRVQRLAIDHADRIAEIDINPLVVTPERAVALDALVVTA